MAIGQIYGYYSPNLDRLIPEIMYADIRLIVEYQWGRPREHLMKLVGVGKWLVDIGTKRVGMA